MELDVVVPVMRPSHVDRLLYSFSRGTDRPETISLVSNAFSDDFETYGKRALSIGAT